MGTRYVWEKYELINSENTSLVSSIQLPSSTHSVTYGCSYRVSNGKFEIYQVKDANGTVKNGTGSLAAYTSASLNPYILYNGFIYENHSNSVAYWYFNERASVNYVYLLTNYSDLTTKIQFQKKELITNVKGDFISYVSSNSANAYPKNGQTNGYYYVYIGADDIEPISISSSALEVSPGDSITVTVTPSTSKVFGGTVFYCYAYAVDPVGTIGYSNEETTVATTKKYTIPTNAQKTFGIRVSVKDDLGYLGSRSHYVLLSISSGHLYVGVSGVARKARKLYIGVNGTARKVKRGYIGINGVARQFYSG